MISKCEITPRHPITLPWRWGGGGAKRRPVAPVSCQVSWRHPTLKCPTIDPKVRNQFQGSPHHPLMWGRRWGAAPACGSGVVPSVAAPGVTRCSHQWSQSAKSLPGVTARPPGAGKAVLCGGEAWWWGCSVKPVVSSPQTPPRPPVTPRHTSTCWALVVVPGEVIPTWCIGGPPIGGWWNFSKSLFLQKVNCQVQETFCPHNHNSWYYIRREGIPNFCIPIEHVADGAHKSECHWGIETFQDESC